MSDTVAQTVVEVTLDSKAVADLAHDKRNAEYVAMLKAEIKKLQETKR